jgi:hypothetical protein
MQISTLWKFVVKRFNRYFLGCPSSWHTLHPKGGQNHSHGNGVLQLKGEGQPGRASDRRGDCQLRRSFADEALAAAAGSLAKASQHPVRDILLGVAGGAFGGLRMSGWNPIGGVIGGVVGGIIAGIEALC